MLSCVLFAYHTVNNNHLFFSEVDQLHGKLLLNPFNPILTLPILHKHFVKYAWLQVQSIIVTTIDKYPLTLKRVRYGKGISGRRDTCNPLLDCRPFYSLHKPTLIRDCSLNMGGGGVEDFVKFSAKK